MNTKTINLLRRGRARIAKPETWTKGFTARDAKGFQIHPTDSAAVRWCAAGAVIASISSEENPERLYESACDGWGELEVRTPEKKLGSYNDRSTHAEVIALFDRTIAELEAANV